MVKFYSFNMDASECWINPFHPKSDSMTYVLLFLMSDDFTRQRETLQVVKD